MRGAAKMIAKAPAAILLPYYPIRISWHVPDANPTHLTPAYLIGTG